MISGIYQIRNAITGYRYIGSSKNIEARLQSHVRKLRRGEHINPHLQRAWNKHGSDCFRFEILETCSLSKLLKREQCYLIAIKKLYNGSRLAHCPEATKEIRKQRSQRAKAQHRAGTIGAKSWKTNPKEVGRKIAATRKKNNSYTAPTFKWTKERKLKVSVAMKKRRALEKLLKLPRPNNPNYRKLLKDRLKELGVS